MAKICISVQWLPQGAEPISSYQEKHLVASVVFHHLLKEFIPYFKNISDTYFVPYLGLSCLLVGGFILVSMNKPLYTT